MTVGNISVTSTPYIQLKNGEYKNFIKSVSGGESQVDLVEEATYDVDGNTIIVYWSEWEGDYSEYQYTISGKKISAICGDEGLKGTKVSDSEVAGAK